MGAQRERERQNEREREREGGRKGGREGEPGWMSLEVVSQCSSSIVKCRRREERRSKGFRV